MIIPKKKKKNQKLIKRFESLVITTVKPSVTRVGKASKFHQLMSIGTMT